MGIALGFVLAILVTRWIQPPVQGSLWVIVAIWLAVGVAWEGLLVHGVLARRRRGKP